MTYGKKILGRVVVKAAVTTAAVFAMTMSSIVSAGMATSAEMKGDMHHGLAKVGKLVVERAWARASVIKTGAAYVTIRNEGKEMDKLVGVSTPVAAKAELHTHIMAPGWAWRSQYG